MTARPTNAPDQPTSPISGQTFGPKRGEDRDETRRETPAQSSEQSSVAAPPATPALAAIAPGVRPEIHIETRGAAAVVTLDRPRALNALTTGMRATLAAELPKIGRDPMIYCLVLRSDNPKAFSSGGDVRELVAWGKSDPGRARRAFADEYRLNWALECFTKPTVSLIDGMVMGSGVGITLFGTHRVAGESYRFAMPETSIGLFPDVGAAHAFARMPDEIGLYLGLTGRSIGRADAYHLGLVTHCIPATEHGAIVDALAGAYPVDPVLDNRHRDPGPSELMTRRSLIAQCFSATSVAGILACLVDLETRQTASDPADAAWAAAVRTDLLARSPTSLALTFRHIRGAGALDLDAVLEIDYRLACRCLEGHDFAEGVRAALIDKDGKPLWQPAAIEQLDPAAIDACFAPLPEGGLDLTPRVKMQSLR